MKTKKNSQKCNETITDNCTRRLHHGPNVGQTDNHVSFWHCLNHEVLGTLLLSQQNASLTNTRHSHLRHQLHNMYIDIKCNCYKNLKKLFKNYEYQPLW